jgi:hypothetical protein
MNAAFRAKARLPAEALAAFRLGPGRAKRKTMVFRREARGQIQTAKARAMKEANKSRNLTAVMALAALFAAAGQARAQETPPACNPKAGHANARIECLTKMVISMNEKLGELRGRSAKTPTQPIHRPI